MSTPVPSQPSQGPQEASQAEQAQNRPGVPKSGKDVNASTTIRTVQDLKQKAPELYQETMKSVAWTITRQLRKSARRLKEIQRKARQKH